MNTKTKQPLKLPTFKDANGAEQEMRFAAPSADGQTFLLVGGGLHVATAEGKLLRRLSQPDVLVTAASVRLSPDGQQVLYRVFHRPDQTHQLLVVPLSGGEPKELVPAGKFKELRARWSPDGKRIAYTCRLKDANEAYLNLLDPDGSNPVTLLTDTTAPLDLSAWH